jgi:hypothetical protein
MIMFEEYVSGDALVFFAVLSFFLVDAYLIIFSKSKIRDIFISIFFWMLFIVFINIY